MSSEAQNLKTLTTPSNNSNIKYATINKKITNNNISNIVLDENYWDYSRTTLKYLTKFIFDFMHIATNTKEIRKHIKDGNIKLSNLN